MDLISMTMLLAISAVGSDSEGPPCCYGIKKSATCRRHCEQLLEMPTNLQQMQHLLTVADHCQRHLSVFWVCLNSSLPALREVKFWAGRPCCDLAVNAICRQRCVNAFSKAEVRRSCSSEKALFACLRAQENGESCCRRSTSLSCGMVCRSLSFSLSTLRHNHSPIRVLERHCVASSVVVRCIQQLAQAQRVSNPADHLSCCTYTRVASCMESCQFALTSTMSVDDIVDHMSADCGMPDLREPIWQCFIQAQSRRENRTTSAAARIDNARLYCCSKTVTTRCRHLCSKTYKSGWSYHSEFFKTCSYVQPVSTIEASMHKCLLDVDEPCRIGCNNLSFCTNFNHRPTELYRSCSLDADLAAEKTFNVWRNGIIRLPQMTIYVKDVRYCEPEKWKAIACALQIKPCLKETPLLTLCREDCIDILHNCVDLTRNQQSIPQLCNALSSLDSIPKGCVPLSWHLSKFSGTNREKTLSQPCHPNPCDVGEICEIRRRKCSHDNRCKQFVCKTACFLGQVSSMSVAKGSSVRIPNPDSDDNQTATECYMGCRCGSDGHLVRCLPLPCLQRRPCRLGTGNSHQHGSRFTLDNGQCVCHDGRLVCSPHTCLFDHRLSPSRTSGSALRGCSMQYDPVCGANGRTYPNMCLARCAGVDRFLSRTACSEYDPCQGSPCQPGQRCVVRYQVCLGRLSQNHCFQHECVDGGEDCGAHHVIRDPVCDTSGHEFTNMCSLFSHRRRSLAYRGNCQDPCPEDGDVCGVDGETYVSECAAMAAGVLADYRGRCQGVGNVSQTAFHSTACPAVECVALHHPYCRGSVPPGACCPVCAAQLMVLYSEPLLDIAGQYMEGQVVTVHNVVATLARLLTIKQCRLFGYLSLDGKLVFLIAPMDPLPSDVQVEACNSEAERLEAMVSNGSPGLTLYLHLSGLLLARSVPIRVSDTGVISSSAVYPGDASQVRLASYLIVAVLLLFATITVKTT